jgi:uncharacterized protein with PQ loop repeat
LIFSMNPSSILGILGTIVGLVRALPQLIVILRSRKVSGVSVDATATSSIVSFGWAIYGFLTNQPYVCLATGSSGVIFLLITIFALLFGRQVREFRIAPIWLCVLFLAYYTARESGLGLVLAVSILAANLPQARVAYQESNLSDLSLGTWLLSMSDGFIWGIYSFLEQDFSIMTFAFFQLTTSGIIVVLKLLKNKIRL